MCGVVGYIGKTNEANDVVLEGLQALEYRGYDSVGIAYLQKSKITISKQVGRVQGLRDTVQTSSSSTIGHTRWATHGEPSSINAHPHYNRDETIAVVHNGIIENHQEIRAFLEDKGYVFLSETDTEVLPHLVDFHFKKTKNMHTAITAALAEIRGAYALLVMTSHEPDTLHAVRVSSPLLFGVSDDALVIASDASALAGKTNRVVYLDDFELATLHRDTSYTIEHLQHGKDTTREAELVDLDVKSAQLGTYAHFMEKEMFEVPETIRNALRGRLNTTTNTVKLGGLESVTDQLRHIDRIVIIACGTSYYAGMVGEYLLEEIAGIPVEVQLASEFKYRNEPLSRSTAVLAISQSGETADTIAALQKVENFGVLRLGIVNVVGSSIARMTDAGVYCHAGPEQAVASTKAFVAQVTVLSLLALHLSDGRSPLYKPVLQELASLPEKAEAVLKTTNSIKKIAEKYANYRDFLYIGRGYTYPCAHEGALKLKELSYIHAEAYAAGEMKHGPLAMIDKDFPTFAIATDSPLLEKTLSNMQEINARKGPIVAIATDKNTTVAALAKDVMYIPSTLEQTQPILIALAEQLFAYYIAVAKNLDVDRPRNLAKSVTVE
jgi:glutamine---fructose-6-phosphate transaminase (isomerizing)